MVPGGGASSGRIPKQSAGAAAARALEMPAVTIASTTIPPEDRAAVRSDRIEAAVMRPTVRLSCRVVVAPPGSDVEALRWSSRMALRSRALGSGWSPSYVAGTLKLKTQTTPYLLRPNRRAVRRRRRPPGRRRISYLPSKWPTKWTSTGASMPLRRRDRRRRVRRSLRATAGLEAPRSIGIRSPRAWIRRGARRPVANPSYGGSRRGNRAKAVILVTSIC